MQTSRLASNVASKLPLGLPWVEANDALFPDVVTIIICMSSCSVELRVSLDCDDVGLIAETIPCQGEGGSC